MEQLEALAGSLNEVLGFEDIFPLSATQGWGVRELRSALLNRSAFEETSLLAPPWLWLGWACCVHERLSQQGSVRLIPTSVFGRAQVASQPHKHTECLTRFCSGLLLRRTHEGS